MQNSKCKMQDARCKMQDAKEHAPVLASALVCILNFAF
jgi:hypothetical protein